MKLSFPYMGCVTAYKKVMELLGHEVVMPQKPTQHTVDLGVLYSPEFICYPFKVMLGTYIEACENGAEVIVSSGGSGPCRAGMYGEIHKKILKQNGFDVEVIIFDSIFADFPKFMRTLRRLLNGNSIFRALHYIHIAFNMACQMDELEKELKIRRAYEINRGDFNRCWEKIVKLYDACNTLKEVRKAKKEAWKLLDAVPMRPVKDSERVRIGIVGEIYVIMESSVNMDVEQRLNNMGIEVYNVQYISDWIKHNIIPRWMNPSKSWKVFDKGKEYKGLNCGGHDMENTGWIIDFAQEGFDGVVHLLPFGCLPELITRSIIPTISEDYNIPILSMSMDEQAGEANTQTRLEAFVELCKSKKEAAETAPVAAHRPTVKEAPKKEEENRQADFLAAK